MMSTPPKPETPKSTSSTPLSGSPKEVISYLQYGDVIELHSQKTPEIDNKSFLVDYLDVAKIRLIQTESMRVYLFHLTSEGEFVDQTVDSIELLMRPKEKGYARQHGLNVGKWLDIYFVGVPDPLTGEITELLEDQIEVLLHPDKEPIYIDFAYRGIPEELSIERFVIRSKPGRPEAAPKEVGPKAPATGAEASMEFTPDNEVIIHYPEDVLYDESYRERLQQEYQDANEILYGPDATEVPEQYESRYEKVFSMDVQLESMLNEFLSNVPNAKRTERIMTNIQYLLERYRELHEMFSNVDQETGEVLGIVKHGPRHKPLKSAMMGASPPPAWIMPVAQTKRFLYELPDETGGAVLGEDDESSGGEEEESTEGGEAATAGPSPDVLLKQMLDPQTEEMPEAGILKKHRGMPTANVNPYTWELANIAPLMSVGDRPNPMFYRPRPVLFEVGVETDTWEAVLDNQPDGAAPFLASSMGGTLKYSNIHTAPFVMQRYAMGFPFLQQDEGGRRKIYEVNREFTPPETISIASWILMSPEVAKFSRIHLPSLSIAKRASYSSLYWMKHADLRRQRDGIRSVALDDLTKNLWSAGSSSPWSVGGTTNFLLDSALLKDEGRRPEAGGEDTTYEQYVETITPNTFDLIESIQSTIPPLDGLSLTRQIEYYEPFLVYMEDLTYSHLNRIRYYMKQRTQAYLKAFHEKKGKKDEWMKRLKRYNQEMGDYLSKNDNLGKSLLEESKLYDIFKSYKIPALGWGDIDYLPLALSNSEILRHVLIRDYMILFSSLLKAVTVSAVIPDEFIELARKDYADVQGKAGMGAQPRNVLAKHYTSLTELQKDNYQEDVFYDANLDDTPYDLLNLYRAEMPKSWTDLENPDVTAFLELLEQNLIQKHGISINESRDLALRLLTKKRRIQEGEYALLDVAGPPAISIYYQRKGNMWVKDAEVDDESFLDMASLIKDAFQRKKSKMAEMTGQGLETAADKEAQNRVILYRRQLAQSELAKRIDITMQERIKQIETEIETQTHRILSQERWRHGQSYKWNYAAHYLGKLYHDELATKGNADGAQAPSPYRKMRDDILRQHDFAKRQQDIVRFAQDFMREPMTDVLGEDPHWMYCVESNAKLMPKFLYDLAVEYLARGEEGYRLLLEKIKQNQELSDDGDAIVDRHSGYVISYIEWANEDLYDERGFKIKTGDVMMEDPATAMDGDEGWNPEGGAGGAGGATLESEDTTAVKSIFETYSRILEISTKMSGGTGGFADFVVRVSLEYIEQNIMTPLDFSIQNEELIKKRGWNETKIQQQYRLYYNQYMIIVVTSIFLIGLQTAQPKIITKKSIPGCVKSFGGYPLTEGTDDQSGIQYMACILNTIKSSFAPWNAVKSAKREVLQESIVDQIGEILERRSDIRDLYDSHRAYRAAHPEEFDIPADLAMSRWMHLLPPANRDVGVAAKLPKDRMDVSLTTMNPKAANTVQAQSILYGYGIMETIDRIVKNKEVLLKTAMGVPFHQNACCSDRASVTPVDYFKKESNQLGVFLGNASFYGELTEAYNKLLKSSMHVFVDDNSIVRKEVGHGNMEELIYCAFIHYCNFDRPDAEIPPYLRAICPTKPDEAHYRRNGSLMEKIQDLKDAGKHYRLEDLEELLKLVNRERRVKTDLRMTKPDAIKLLTDFLGEATEVATPHPRLEEIRPLLLNILVKYDPQVALPENPKEEGEYHKLLNELKDVLIPRNQEMMDRILAFLSKYGNVNPRSVAYSRLKKTLEEIVGDLGTGDDLYESIQFVRNNLVFTTKIVPEMILNGVRPDRLDIPKHWDFSGVHETRISKMITDYYMGFAKFYSMEEEAGSAGGATLTPAEQGFRKILRLVSAKMADFVLLSQYVPVTKTIEAPQGAPTETPKYWFRFLDRDTIRFLFSYMWYSVLDQYVEMTDTEMQSEFSSKTARRGQVKASKNVVEETKMKQRLAEYLLVFVQLIQDDKTRLNMSYSEIMKKVYRDRDVEKKGMMSRFENASNSDLKYVNMEKRFKIGRWLMEDVHKYKKTRYDQEVEEMLYQELGAEGVTEGAEGARRAEGERESAYADEPNEYGDDDVFGEYGEDQDMMDPDREYASDAEDMDYEND